MKLSATNVLVVTAVAVYVLKPGITRSWGGGGRRKGSSPSKTSRYGSPIKPMSNSGLGVGNSMGRRTSGISTSNMLSAVSMGFIVSRSHRVRLYSRNYYYGRDSYFGPPKGYRVCQYDISGNFSFDNLTNAEWYFNSTDTTSSIIFSCQSDYACCQLDCCQVDTAIWVWIIIGCALLIATVITKFIIYKCVTKHSRVRNIIDNDDGINRAIELNTNQQDKITDMKYDELPHGFSDTLTSHQNSYAPPPNIMIVQNSTNMTRSNENSDKTQLDQTNHIATNRLMAQRSSTVSYADGSCVKQEDSIDWISNSDSQKTVGNDIELPVKVSGDNDSTADYESLRVGCTKIADTEYISPRLELQLKNAEIVRFTIGTPNTEEND